MGDLTRNLSKSELLKGSGYRSWSAVPREVKVRAAWFADKGFQPFRARWEEVVRKWYATTGSSHFGLQFNPRYAYVSIVRGGGIRTSATNKAIYKDKKRKPTRKSRHEWGDAIDPKPHKSLRAIWPGSTLAMYDLLAEMQKAGDIPAGGLAIYTKVDKKTGLLILRFCHFDGRGRRARWNAGHIKKARAAVKAGRVIGVAG